MICNLNVFKNKINNKQNLLKKNDDKFTDELESTKIEMELLNEKLKTIEAELLNEKNNNFKLMNSYVSTLEKCKDLESDVLSHKEKLDNQNKEMENVIVEKSNLLKQYIITNTI